MGYCGQLSLGHALYVGLGAYVSALLWVKFGIGPWLGIAPAMLVAAAAGAAIGWLSFRFGIEGVYFALLTIAFAEVARIGADNLSFTGGAAGLFLPYDAARMGEWWNLRGGQTLFYYVALALMLGSLALTAYLARTRLGFQWLAVREDQEAARSLGISVLGAKMAAIVISSAMTAVGGVFYAFYYNNLFPAQIFDMSRSIELILAPVIGGLGTVFGPLIGALILTPLGETVISATAALGIDVPGVKAVFYGVALMVIIALRPGGVWPPLVRALRLTRTRP
jgi:branched-chain amino acid transport system permease protein